jgi:cytochrome c oxidase subunit 2
LLLDIDSATTLVQTRETAIQRVKNTIVKTALHSTIAAGAALNTPENLRLWIQNPEAIKRGSLMPAMKLSESDVDALAGYLETLR